MSEVESLINIPVEHCSNIFGQFDEYAKVIEKTLKVTIIVRDSSVKYLIICMSCLREATRLQDRMLIILLHSHLKKRLIH